MNTQPSPTISALVQASDSLTTLLNHAEAAAGTSPAYYVLEPIDGLLDQAIAVAQAALVPAGRQAAYEGVRFAVKVLSAKLPDNDVLSAYAAVLEDLPGDLLGKALKGGLGTQEWHKLPTPGAFLAPVRNELEARRYRLGLLLRHRNRVQLVSRTQPHREQRQLEAAPLRLPPTRLRRIDET